MSNDFYIFPNLISLRSIFMLMIITIPLVINFVCVLYIIEFPLT